MPYGSGDPGEIIHAVNLFQAVVNLLKIPGVTLPDGELGADHGRRNTMIAADLDEIHRLERLRHEAVFGLVLRIGLRRQLQSTQRREHLERRRTADADGIRSAIEIHRTDVTEIRL